VVAMVAVLGILLIQQVLSLQIINQFMSRMDSNTNVDQ